MLLHAGLWNLTDRAASRRRRPLRFLCRPGVLLSSAVHPVFLWDAPASFIERQFVAERRSPKRAFSGSTARQIL